MASVDAIVVHYRGGEVLERCVRSCLEAQDVGSVVVVDNEGVGPELRSRLPDPRVRIVQMAGNAGYGRAANVGLGLVTADAALLLNQDTEIPSDAPARLLRVAEASEAWLVGPTLVGPDGSISPPKDGFPRPLARDVPTEGGNGWRYVPWIPGAAMLFAPGHLELRFDERLFMYVEDEELCWRVWDGGGRVALARVLVHHAGGTATATRWSPRGIAVRTVAGRARMVRWHAGRLAAARYVGSAGRRRLRRR